MSASSKKKIRKEQELEKLTQRQLQEKKESKKTKVISIAFILGLVAILVTFGIVFVTDLFERNNGDWTTVATIGDHDLSLTEFNYYYVDSVNEYADNIYSTAEYGDSMGLGVNETILSIYGIDVKKPISEQTNEATGVKYADEFVETALNKAARVYALCDAAEKAGFELSAEEQASIDSLSETLTNYATWTNSPSVEYFIRYSYGYGQYADLDSYVEYCQRNALAEAYLAHYTESLSYDDAALRAAEGDTPEDYNTYSYSYYTVEVEKFLNGGTTAEDGTVTYSDAEKEAARVAAEAAANQLAAAETVEEFNDKVAHLYTAETEEESSEAENPEAETTEAETAETETTEAETAEAETTEAETAEAENAEAENTEAEDAEDIDVEIENAEGEPVDQPEEENTDGDEHDHEHEEPITSEDVIHTSAKSEFRDWFAKAETVAGSTTVLPKTENDEITGYFVVYLTDKSDNKEPLVNVRHVLVKVADSKTEEDWAAAEKKANDLLAQWQKGEKTEASFAEFAKNNTEDEGSKEDGGLIPDIHKNSSLVEDFLNWSIDKTRKVGDVGIVKSEYGYHIMYFAEYQKTTYRDYMIANSLRSKDAAQWETDLIAKYTVVKEDIDEIDKDMVSFDRGYES